MTSHIDLNSDLGESFGAWKMGHDEQMLKIVSSANIATGFHAGDPLVMMNTVKAALNNGAAIGAHVAYRDLVGFGRRNMDVAPEALRADVIYQIGALQAVAQAHGARVSYVKPHGALYNTIAADKTQAMAVLEAISLLGGELSLVVLAGSALTDWAREMNIPVIAEAFADRAYHPDGSLVSRREEGAVLHDPAQIAERMLSLIKEGRLRSIEGGFTPLQADSICVHGDTPGAVAIASQLRCALESEGIQIKPCAPA